MKILKINEVNLISKHAVIIIEPELDVEKQLADVIAKKLTVAQQEAFHGTPKIFRLKNQSLGVETIVPSILDLISNYAIDLFRIYKADPALAHRINEVDKNSFYYLSIMMQISKRYLLWLLPFDNKYYSFTIFFLILLKENLVIPKKEAICVKGTL